MTCKQSAHGLLEQHMRNWIMDGVFMMCAATSAASAATALNLSCFSAPGAAA